MLSNLGRSILRRMKVSIVPVLEDNYSYILIDEQTKIAAAIDPAEPHKVFIQAEKEGVNITSILTTHHHWDHSEGNNEFVEKKPGTAVYGGDARVQGLTHYVKDGEFIKIGNLTVKALATPCHTSGSISYLVEGKNNEPDVVFTGDTLFVAGCGKFFEGSATQMLHNMEQVYRSLKPQTLVYPGHEYTVSNLKFALHLEPNNQAAQEKKKWSEAQRANGQPTVPSTLADEFQFNPFMRTRESSIQQATKQTDPIQVMHVLREMKNHFKPQL